MVLQNIIEIPPHVFDRTASFVTSDRVPNNGPSRADSPSPPLCFLVYVLTCLVPLRNRLYHPLLYCGGSPQVPMSYPSHVRMSGTMPSQAGDVNRFCLDSDLSGQGGMGTSGSLGVNYAAPLTRGGFAGEIFDDAPMPTGNWKNAPTPVMLGTGDPTLTGDQAALGSALLIASVFQLVISGFIWYGAYQYYFGDKTRNKR